MDAILSQQRRAIPLGACAVGIAVLWLAKTPFGLLPPMAALLLFARDRAALPLYVASAIGLAGTLFVVAFHGVAHDLAVTWAAFFAVALCLGAIVSAGAPAPRSAEAMPVAMSTGRSETPSYPVVGPSLEEKAAPRYSPAVSIAAADDITSAAQLVAVSFWGGLPLHLRYWRREAGGRHRWVESRSEPLREPSGTRLWSSVTADIDDQRPAEAPPTKIASNPESDDEAVRAAKVVENLLGNAWAFDAAGRPTYLSPLAQTFVAVTLEEFQAEVDDGHTFFKRTAHPDDYDRISAAWRRSLQTGEPFFLDRRIRRASGIHEWNRTGFVPTRDRQGRVTGWYGSTIDLDSHRIAQAELRDRERELSQLVNMVPVHIRRLTPDGEAIFWNKRSIDFIGMEPAELRAAGTAAFVHPDDAGGVRDTIRRSLATGDPWALKYRLRRADGVYRWVEDRAEPMRNQDGTIEQWYAVSVDIDDYMRVQQAEEALRQASAKLAHATQAASLAELSASIAHEVNQPLGAIVANSHACQRWLSADPANVERAKITVERIIRDANAAADVVSRIRALFKQSGETRISTALPSVVAEARDLMAEEAIRRRIRVDVDVEHNLPLVTLDRVQVQQVLINLIRNGMDAMDSIAGDKILGLRVRRLGDAVQTEISDRGPGVAFPDRIFEPFFTTKPSGMGMGLAICRSIIESHGGRLWVETTASSGATFIFTLPVEPRGAS